MNKIPLLEKITSGMGEGLIASDSDGVIIFSNDMACKILGYESGELIGEDLHNKIHHHDKHGNFVPKEKCTTYLALKRSNIYKTNEELFFTKTGAPVEVSYTATPMTEDGEAIGSVIIFSDISEQNRIKKRLLLADIVLQSIEEAVVVTDKSNSIIYVNPYFSAVTGYSLDEVLGKNPKVFQSGKHNSSFYKHMWKAITKSGSWNGEIENRKKSGKIFIEWLHIRVVKDSCDEIIYYVAIFSDITSRKRLEERLREDKDIFERQACVDELTGLYNRRKFNELLERQLGGAERYGIKFSLIILDIDFFKKVNDTYGHLVGDDVLVDVSRLVEANIRISDTLARWGGEEFVILTIETLGERAIAFGENLRRKIEEFSFAKVGKITASFGIASYEVGDTIDSIITKADNALYEAKQNGRNMVALWDY